MDTKNITIDEGIIVKAQEGDRQSLALLCQASMQTVYYISLKLVQNKDDAEDIVSETMITLIKKIKDLKEPAAFYGWIKRIAVNKCNDFLAKNKPVLLGDDEENFLEEAELENYNEEFLPEEYAISNEKRNALLEIIKNCTTKNEMMTIILFYYNGDNVKTIAENMNCAEITVKTRLASARKKIKKGIEEKYGKGATLMALVGAFVLSKAMEAEASECEIALEVCQKVMSAAGQAATELQAVEGASNVAGMQNMEGASNVAGMQNMEGASNVAGMQNMEGASDAAGMQNMEGASNVAGIQAMADSSNAAGMKVIGEHIMKTGISKGLIAAISAVGVGAVGIVAAVIIATSGNDSDGGKDNPSVNITTEYSADNQNRETQEKGDNDATDDNKDKTTDKVTNETTKEDVTEEPTTEAVVELERYEVKSIDYVPAAVLNEELLKGEFIWNQTEEEFLNWYKDKGYYDLSEPKCIIEGTYDLKYASRTFTISNGRVYGENKDKYENTKLVLHTNRLNSDVPCKVYFEYQGELETAVEKVKEFIAYIGLGDYAEELVHANNRLTIIPEDGIGKYTIVPIYSYDNFNKIHRLSIEIEFSDTMLDMITKTSNEPAGMQYIDDLFDLSTYLPDATMNVKSLDALKNELLEYLVNNVDATYHEYDLNKKANYTYTYYPESDGKESTLEFEYESDISQKEKPFDVNRFKVTFNKDKEVYIKVPVNADLGKPKYKFDELTDEDIMKISEERLKVLKKLVPTITFTAEELAQAMKDKQVDNYTYLLFNIGDYKCKLGCELSYMEIMINRED